VAAAQKAWRELELGQVSQADKQRCWVVLDGLTALDDEQAALKGDIEELVLEFFNPNAADDGVNALLRRLLDIVMPAAVKRSPEDQAALDSIARELAKEEKLCLKERPKRPTRAAIRKSMGNAGSNKPASG